MKEREINDLDRPIYLECLVCHLDDQDEFRELWRFLGIQRVKAAVESNGLTFILSFKFRKRKFNSFIWYHIL